MTSGEEFVESLRCMDPQMARSCLRHPAWNVRCDCRVYGQPFGEPLLVIDVDLVHGPEVCQPAREFLWEGL